jgi:hypothetical protein
MSPFACGATSERDIILPGGGVSRGRRGVACGPWLAAGAAGSSLAALAVAGGLMRNRITF